MKVIEWEYNEENKKDLLDDFDVRISVGRSIKTSETNSLLLYWRYNSASKDETYFVLACDDVRQFISYPITRDKIVSAIDSSMCLFKNILHNNLKEHNAQLPDIAFTSDNELVNRLLLEFGDKAE